MTTTRTQLAVSKRDVKGKKVKNLRLKGILPGHVFGNGTGNVDIQVEAKLFAKTYKKVGETGVIDLQIEGEKDSRPVLVDDYAVHPVSGNMLHVDFHQVNLSVKVTATVPVETIGESAAVVGGGVLVMVYSELEVEALPTDLPNRLEVDLSKLVKVGDDFKFSDLVYDRAKVEILDIEEDGVLATIQAPKEEVVEEVAAPTEVEVLKGATTEAGKEAAAGGAAPVKTDDKKSDKKE